MQIPGEKIGFNGTPNSRQTPFWNGQQDGRLSVRDWARAHMPAGGDLPLFGSPEWEAADERVRVGSCIRAALTWLHERDPHVIAARLEVELEASWAAVEADYEAWKRVAAMVRHLPNTPTYAELVERRGAA